MRFLMLISNSGSEEERHAPTFLCSEFLVVSFSSDGITFHSQRYLKN